MIQLLVILISLFLVKCEGGILSQWFTEQPQYAVTLISESVFLHCKTVDPVANTKLRWLHNNTLISTKDPIYQVRGESLSFELDQKGHRLGEYRCVSPYADKFFIATVPAKLSIAYLNDFKLSRSQNIEVFDTNNVIIGCDVPKSNPPAFIQFYKNQQTINTDQGRFQMINGESLFIVNATENDSGDYTCSASNHITNENKSSASISSLKVNYSNKYEKAKLTFSPQESYEVVEGDNITIPCGASGYPKPDIVWSRLENDEKIPASHSPNGCLQIINAQFSDGGNYMCAIFNGARRFIRKTTLIVTSPPKFIQKPSVTKENSIISEGGELHLHCQASGNPQPIITWFSNGLPIKSGSSKELFDNGTLYIPFVRKEDRGIYQCFIENSFGYDVESLLIKVADNNLISDEEKELWNSPEYFNHLPMVPPTKPIVSQKSSDTALVTWSMPGGDENSLTGEIMPVQFFKIQFREFSNGRRSNWRTLDENINSKMRSFEVLGLKKSIKYRFRIVAVYANNDNLSGALSERFRLRELRGNRDAPPKTVPRITNILPLSENSLRVGWSLNAPIHEAPVDGYFVFFRETKREKPLDFKRITIIVNASHTYLIRNLKPKTIYEFKVKSFNFFGSSPPSKTIRAKTLPIKNQTNNLNTTSKSLERDDHLGNFIDDGQVTLYLVLAAILVGAVLVLIICCSLLSCLRKKKIRKSYEKEIVDDKYLNRSHHKYNSSIDGPYQNSDQQIYASTSQTVETSFSSPNRLSQFLSIRDQSNDVSSSFIASQEQVSRNPNMTSDDSGYELDPNTFADRLSVNYEEYTDEPSRLSWKRRRKSEEVL